MKDHDLAPYQCLDCGHRFDAATAIESDQAPNPGDFSVCLYCGHIAAFTDDCQLRPLTDAEVIELAGNPKILTMQRARTGFKKYHED